MKTSALCVTAKECMSLLSARLVSPIGGRSKYYTFWTALPLFFIDELAHSMWPAPLFPLSHRDRLRHRGR